MLKTVGLVFRNTGIGALRDSENKSLKRSFRVYWNEQERMKTDIDACPRPTLKLAENTNLK